MIRAVMELAPRADKRQSMLEILPSLKSMFVSNQGVQPVAFRSCTRLARNSVLWDDGDLPKGYILIANPDGTSAF